MFKKLLPKEEKYFEDFKDMISNIEQMATYLHTMYTAETIDTSLLLKIRPLEKRCDEITEKIQKRLNKTFITPFDREDIFALTKRLANISDMLLGAGARLETFGIKKRINHADKIALIILQQVKELGTAIQDLKVKSINECKAVKTLESEADKVYHQAIRELFAYETDAITLIKHKEILDLLEQTADKCQSAANVIISIFIKNA